MRDAVYQICIEKLCNKAFPIWNLNISMEQSQIFVLLCFGGAIISSTCSLLNLFLIWDMRVWNGHIALITSMTFFQLIYDASFYNNNVSDPESVTYKLTSILQIWGGISQSLISNEIAFSVLYILMFKRPFNIFKNFGLLMGFANIPSILVCIFYCVYVATGDETLNSDTLLSYSYIRIGSIFLVFLIYAYTALLVNQMKSKDPTIIIQEQAIKILVGRLKYYPLVQAISRIGYSWYEIEYGFNFNPNSVSRIQFASQCVVAIATPLGSVGYFVIFLLMQPHAYKFLKTRLTTGKRFKNPHNVFGPLLDFDNDDANINNSGWGPTSPKNLDEDTLFNIMGEDSVAGSLLGDGERMSSNDKIYSNISDSFKKEIIHSF